MDEETGQVQENEIKQEVPKKPSGKFAIPRWLLVSLLVVVVAAASAYGTYLWCDSVASSFEKQQNEDIEKCKDQVTSLESQLTDLKTSSNTTNTDSETTCTEVAPNAAAIDNIKLSITSADTSPLIGHMASSVNVILAATEKYGAQTPTQAVTDITNFLSTDINSWDYNFSLPSAILSGYQNGNYSKYFSAISIVGKASNNQVISFSFNCNGKIDTVFLLQ